MNDDDVDYDGDEIVFHDKEKAEQTLAYLFNETRALDAPRSKKDVMIRLSLDKLDKLSSKLQKANVAIDALPVPIHNTHPMLELLATVEEMVESAAQTSGIEKKMQQMKDTLRTVEKELAIARDTIRTLEAGLATERQHAEAQLAEMRKLLAHYAAPSVSRRVLTIRRWKENG